MPLNDDELKIARKRLDDELAAVEGELVDIGFPSEGAVDVNFDEGFADAAQSTSERAKAISLAEGLRQRLEDVKGALGRLDKGTYGLCTSCGEEIPAERLEAIPAASLCITCKQKQQQQQA